MTPNEFANIANTRLVSAWKMRGKSAYTPDQMAELWDIVKGISAADFTQALDVLDKGRKSEYPSTIGQIRGACLPAIEREDELKRRSEIKTMKATEFECPLCYNSGWVEAHKNDAPIYKYSFICSCAASDSWGVGPGRGVTHWSDACKNDAWILSSPGRAAKAMTWDNIA